MNYRYKIEIILDDEKIISDDEYEIKDIYNAISNCFLEEGIQEVQSEDNTMVFISNDYEHDDFSAFGVVENILFDSDWFRTYVKKMTWYNSSYGKDYCEDVIEAYKMEGFYNE